MLCLNDLFSLIENSEWNYTFFARDTVCTAFPQVLHVNLFIHYLIPIRKRTYTITKPAKINIALAHAL